MTLLSSQAVLEQTNVTVSHPTRVGSSSLAIQPLINEDQAEVLTFLAARPIHTVVMASFIRDNGLVSRFNRGTFYACRDQDDHLEGIALIGHTTLMEARTETALQAFAGLAQKCPAARMIIGERERIERFWRYYSVGGRSPRLICRELLFEQRGPSEAGGFVEGLRRAAVNDLELIVPVHAQMALEESGINPLEIDPTGFRRRCLRRIRQDRIWVWVENGKLIFKADVVAETPEVLYLEGLYVSPEERGKGYGARCLAQLSRALLTRDRSICLLVNEQNQKTQAFYLKAGYKLCAHYDTIFLQYGGQ